MTTEKLFDEALKLDPLSRANLAHGILATVESDDDGELSAEWKAEIDRRLAEIDKHPDRGISWEELKKSLTSRRR